MIQRLQHYLRRLVLDNFFLKAGSFILAFILWIYVQNQGKIEQRVDVKIGRENFQGLPEGEDIRLYKASTDLISIKLRGLPSAMVHIDKHCDLLIDIPQNFTDWGKEYTVELKNSNIQGLPFGAEILSISPVNITFMLDYQFQKPVDVEINLIGGHPLEGFMVSSQHVTPKQVLLTGPRSIVELQTKIMTELTQISKNRVDYIKRVPLILPSREVFCTPEYVEIEFKIQEIIETRKFNNLAMLPKIVPGTDTKVVYEPTTVAVIIQGPHNDIKVLRRENVSVLLDVLQLPADDKWRSITPSVEFPPEFGGRLKSIKFEPEKIRVKVEKTKSEN